MDHKLLLVSAMASVTLWMGFNVCVSLFVFVFGFNSSIAWLVALRMWFNSFLEALKMLTWCLHSKLDKMGQNGSTKKTGNRQLLHQERSCILLQKNKISSSLGIWEEFFFRTIQRQIKILRHSLDILCYRKNAVEFAGFSILQYLTIALFFVSVMKIFQNNWNLGNLSFFFLAQKATRVLQS